MTATKAGALLIATIGLALVAAEQVQGRQQALGRGLRLEAQLLVASTKRDATLQIALRNASDAAVPICHLGWTAEVDSLPIGGGGRSGHCSDRNEFAEVPARGRLVLEVQHFYDVDFRRGSRFRVQVLVVLEERGASEGLAATGRVR